MWNRSSSWEKRVRRIAGGVVLAACVITPFTISADEQGENSAAGALSSGVGDVVSGLDGRTDRRFRLLMNDVELERFDGTIVYARLPNGTGEIVSRIQKDEGGYWLQLPEKLAKQAEKGGALLYAEPVYYLDESIPVVLAPDGLEGEFQIAYDELWPVVDAQLIAPVKERLRVEIKALLQDIVEEESELMETMASDLFEELSPELDELGGRVTTRAWDEIGVWGVTVGVARKGLNAAEKGWTKLKDLFMEDVDNPEERAFLSDERKTKLKAAITDELQDYWAEKGDDIKEKTAAVLERYEGDLTTKAESEWLPRLFERAVMPQWEKQQNKLLLAVSRYLEDMANRRLVTEEGSLMLPLAYAFRTAAEITDRPLLVFQPGPHGGKGTLELLPLETHLAPLSAEARQ